MRPKKNVFFFSALISPISFFWIAKAVIPSMNWVMLVYKACIFAGYVLPVTARKGSIGVAILHKEDLLALTIPVR